MIREALTLYRLAEKFFGGELFEVEPQTIMAGLQVEPLECEKIQAMANMVKNHTFFTDYHIFQKTVQVFNDTPADFEYHAEILPAEVAWAVQQVRLVDPVNLFNNEVLAYIALVLHEDGFINVPAELANEKSIEGFSLAHFLRQVNINNDHNEASLKVEKAKEGAITLYCSHRMEKLSKEADVSNHH